jgi:hypothetical protein
MKAKYPIKFIEGKFSPDDAKEILIDLINYKIHFHSLKNFSYEECFGKPVEGSQKRIEELKATREKIILLIQQAIDNNTNLRIESSIHIAFEK